MERRDVFSSYVEEDGELARALARELRALGHSSWTYEEDGIGGVSYLVQVHDAIDACDTFVLLASLISVRSHQLIREVEHAHESQKVIVPVRVGITQQQFVTSNPILSMASGTAVTVSADDRDTVSLAKRIHATIVFAASSPHTDRREDAYSDVATRGRDPADHPAKQRALPKSPEATLRAFSNAKTTDGEELSNAAPTDVAGPDQPPVGTVESRKRRWLVANGHAPGRVNAFETT